MSVWLRDSWWWSEWLAVWLNNITLIQKYCGIWFSDESFPSNRSCASTTKFSAHWQFPNIIVACLQDAEIMPASPTITVWQSGTIEVVPGEDYTTLLHGLSYTSYSLSCCSVSVDNRHKWPKLICTKPLNPSRHFTKREKAGRWQSSYKLTQAASEAWKLSQT